MVYADALLVIPTQAALLVIPTQAALLVIPA
jgi:hypothetical protein